MNAQLFTYPLDTGEITVISNVNSIVAIGSTISRIRSTEATAGKAATYLHVNLDVARPTETPTTVLGHTEHLCLILRDRDAVELGLLLAAMSL